MRILFINGSPNKNGNTAALAKRVAGNAQMRVLSLTDYRINCYGQSLEGDRFGEVLDAIGQADTVIIGSPLYWHNICGAVRNLLDRFYGPVEQGAFSGKKLCFVYQGAAPEAWMMEAGEYTMKRFASLYGFVYMGMVTDAKQADQLSQRMKA